MQVSIKTFGSTVERLELVEVVALGVQLNGEPDLSLSAFTLPLICQPVQDQPVEQAVKNNHGLSGLKLADCCSEWETLGVDILVGLNYHWKLVTSHTIKGAQGPTAVHTKLAGYFQDPFAQGV